MPTAARRAAVLALLLTALGPPAASAGFEAPERVSSGSQPTGGHAVALDPFEVLHVAFVEGDALWVRSRGAELDRSAVIAPFARQPALVASPVDLVLAWVEDPPSGQGPALAFGRKRYQAALDRQTVPTEGEPSRPRLRLTRRREVRLVWEEAPAGGRSEVVFLAEGFPRVSLGPGERPSLEVDDEGISTVVFARGGMLWVKHDGVIPGHFGPPARLAPEAAGVTIGPRTSRLPDGTLLVAWAGEGALYLARRLPQGETRVQEVERGRIDSLSLARGSAATGVLALAWASPEGVFRSVGNSFFLSPPEAVDGRRGGGRAPEIDADADGNTFVAFEREGDLWLSSDATPPRAEFVASPREGNAPLEVTFRDRSSGDIARWQWEFADGGTSGQREPTHVFSESGEYPVRLTVFGPTGAASHFEQRVLVADPRNRMWIADVAAFPGLRRVFVPVLVIHDEPIQGFQLAARFDPEFVDPVDVDFSETNIGALDAELLAFNVSRDPADPWVTAGVLFDIEPPFDRRVLPPGRAQRIASIVVDLSADAPPDTRTSIELRNGLGDPPLSNILTVRSRTVLPVLGPAGVVHLRQLTFPPPRFFLRGDADGDGKVTISDAIAILRHLFLGAPAPACLDSADGTDDGRLDISDPSFLLNFLFRGGAYPLPPYPRPGLDPTPDPLPECGL